MTKNMNIFVPLTTDLIDEGGFETDLNKNLANMQEQIIRHARLYGLKAKKAKAVMKAEISLICLDPEQQAFACVAQIKTTLPPVPASASMLMSGQTQTGEDCLFCRQSGSNADNPRQAILSTADGRTVDPVSGEIMPAG